MRASLLSLLLALALLLPALGCSQEPTLVDGSAPVCEGAMPAGCCCYPSSDSLPPFTCVEGTWQCPDGADYHTGADCGLGPCGGPCTQPCP